MFNRGERTCGNCVFCHFNYDTDNYGTCNMSKKKDTVPRKATAKEKNCKNHLYKKLEGEE